MARPIEEDGRRVRARRTRARIVDAATRLFLEHGYLATTIEAVAELGGVAVQTVYYVFGTKRNLLAAVLDATIAGDAENVPVVEQAWVDDLAAAPDASSALEVLAERATVIVARTAPIYDVVRCAAADPEVAELLAANRRARRADQRRLAEILWQAGHLRPGLDVDTAADIIYGLVNEDVLFLLTVDCGWDVDRFRALIGSVLRHELLGVR